MPLNESLPPDLLTYEVSTDPDPLYINDPDSNLLITIRKSTDVYLDEIFIEVPADSGSSADTLFLTDPALTYRMTPDTDWQLLEVSTNKSGNVPMIQFSVKPKGSANQITEDLHVTITGTSNADKGTAEVSIGEHSGKSPGQYEYHETKFPVTKSAAMPFYLNNLISFDPNDSDTPKLSFKTSDEIYLSWDSNGTSYELFPKDLVTTGNPTTDTHITIPAGKVIKDQTIVIKATDGGKTLYQSLNICIENPELTPTRSLISGEPNEDSLRIDKGNAIITGDEFLVNSPTVFLTNDFRIISEKGSKYGSLSFADNTTITGDLTVKPDESGESTTHLDKLFVDKDCQLGETHIDGGTTISGSVTINPHSQTDNKIEADMDADFHKKVTVADKLTVNGSIQANGGILVGDNAVSLLKTPVQFIHGTSNVSGEFNALTDGYLIVPNKGTSGNLLVLISTVLVAYPGLDYNLEYVQIFSPLDTGPTGSGAGSLIIPLPRSARTVLTFTAQSLPFEPDDFSYYVYWMPMGGGGGQSYQWFPNPDTEPLPEEFLTVRRKHDAIIEKMRQKPQKAKSFIQSLEKAFGQTLGEDERNSLLRDLESML